MSRYVISLSPHEKGTYTVNTVMWGVVVALIPAFVSSVMNFGIRAVAVTAVALISCILFEFLIQKFLMKCTVTAFDGSAAITGILLAFNLPSSIPLWQVVVGSLVAIAVGKMAFGGLGKNPFNPALIGRGFMLMSFPVDMTTWPIPGKSIWIWDIASKVDSLTAATPLGIVKEGLAKGEEISMLAAKTPELWELFLGTVGGSLGETSALAIIIGGIYLIYKKIITWHIPFFYLATIFAFTGIAWLVKPDAFFDPVFHILSGGVMLGAFFMMTDMVTSPMSVKGQIVFAIGAGIICSAIRLFGAYPEGCMFSILIMNAFVPLIDKYILPKKFGKEVNYVG
ncbi:MAG TPA: RnfABCDGE type electron transport complex subunit D [bacterium]|nr:RnfABCDGE type electron transport complex subunit D [bacterium]HQN72578.1 RnfABCDGE type electron transport complex subunit D [bacterium]